MRHVNKPCWNDVLNGLWLEFHEAEKVYIKTNGSLQGLSELKRYLLNKYQAFDREQHATVDVHSKGGNFMTSKNH